MAGYNWTFTVLPNTITEIILNEVITVQKSAGQFEANYFVEGTDVTISADGYQTKTVTVGDEQITLIADIKYLSKLSNGTATYVIKDANAVHTEDVTSTYSPTGTAPVNGTAVASSISSKSNIDLSDLSQTGKNIGNWSTNTTNCVVEIPQDINLELNNGTLTLKAGSKVYVKGDTTTPTYTITSDKTATQTTNGSYFAFYDGTNLITYLKTTYDYTTLPSTTSLPIAEITVSNGAISSIDKVFNGFGYIGSTIFALPGIKGLVPNGRNDDGSLNSTLFTSSVVKTITVTGTHNDWDIVLNASNIWAGVYSYNNEENQNYSSAGNPVGRCIVAKFSVNNGSIVSLNAKKVFHAVDYSDFMNTVGDIEITYDSTNKRLIFGGGN